MGIQKQGRYFEDSTLKVCGQDALNLNDIGKGNFPTFDITSSEELNSVKSHISTDGNISPQNLQSYRNDFYHLMGWGRPYDAGKTPLEQDAERIMDLSSSGFPTPDELKGANQQQVVDYLKTKTLMRIPDDHVDPVRQSLAADIRTFPENYGLVGEPNSEQIETLLERVQGTGSTSKMYIDQTMEEVSTNQESQNQNSDNPRGDGLSDSVEENYDYGHGLY